MFLQDAYGFFAAKEENNAPQSRPIYLDEEAQMGEDRLMRYRGFRGE